MCTKLPTLRLALRRLSQMLRAVPANRALRTYYASARPTKVARPSHSIGSVSAALKVVLCKVKRSLASVSLMPISTSPSRCLERCASFPSRRHFGHGERASSSDLVACPQRGGGVPQVHGQRQDRFGDLGIRQHKCKARTCCEADEPGHELCCLESPPSLLVCSFPSVGTAGDEHSAR